MTTFNQKYLETNVALLQAEAGVSAANWNTAVGSRIKSTIQTRLNAFGLLNKQGCSPKRYSNSATAADADSIYRLLVDTVFPKVGPSEEMSRPQMGKMSNLCQTLSPLCTSNKRTCDTHSSKALC
ncbi:hypothetical protein BLNAU_25078 [Blattamonas nauphoetae]|uniref:Uncharacterized protein n=1 Tax=Blattamonas nauphoetae TaxID=2049346 RepID=A0ABQ9WKL2_9EUKA|nr:hypothetical protein BLNAU_25078 [Blattamonas nauphoetae]